MKFLVLLVILKFAFAIKYEMKTFETCVDTENNEGICVHYETCEKIMKTFGGKGERYLLDQFFVETKPCGMLRMCCVETNAPSYFRELLNKLPPPPFCGEIRLWVKDMFGATPTKLYNYPWTVLLYYVNTKRRTIVKPWCTGSLISDRYVITAAHCVVNTGKWKLTSVRIGEYNTETEIDCDEGEKEACAEEINHQDFEIDETMVHENYDHVLAHNDIALIRLSNDTNQNSYSRPVCLPWRKNQENSSYIVAGWGLSETGQMRTIKGRVDLPKVEQEDCVKLFKNYNKIIEETQICAGGENGKDTCDGDSGGPLMMKTRPGELFGITSYGAFKTNENGDKACGTPGIPAVYTRVDSFIEWILKNIKEEVDLKENLIEAEKPKLDSNGLRGYGYKYD